MLFLEIFVYFWQDFYAKSKGKYQVLENQPTADCKVGNNYYYYLATIIQKNLFHFPKPLRIVVLFPSAGNTTEPHLIYSAEISATGTIPSTAVLL